MSRSTLTSRSASRGRRGRMVRRQGSRSPLVPDPVRVGQFRRFVRLATLTLCFGVRDVAVQCFEGSGDAQEFVSGRLRRIGREESAATQSRSALETARVTVVRLGYWWRTTSDAAETAGPGPRHDPRRRELEDRRCGAKSADSRGRRLGLRRRRSRGRRRGRSRGTETPLAIEVPRRAHAAQAIRGRAPGHAIG